jgi:phosphosulfolactate synthase
MTRDLAAGASWVIAEGRESGTVGLYHADHRVREDLVSAILAWIPQDKVIFEAPAKSQQAWFVQAPVTGRLVGARGPRLPLLVAGTALASRWKIKIALGNSAEN